MTSKWTLRLAALVILVAGFLVIPALEASAAVISVTPGHSIQAAINAASPNDTINISNAVYQENLFINKDGIHLVGNGARLIPPGSPTANPCVDGSTFPGICVSGQFNIKGKLVTPVKNVRIDGLVIDGFSGEGVFSDGTEGFTAYNNEFRNNASYGIFSLQATYVSYLYNTSHDNHDAGFYVGDSPHANVAITGNTSYGNTAEGLLFRDSKFGTINNNDLHDNCIGALLLDTGSPTPGGRVTFRNNTVHDNNMFCPAAGPDPARGGLGVGVAGVDYSFVTFNTITNNHEQVGSTIPGGGIVLFDTTPFGGRPPRNDTIKHNTLSGNTPFDIFDDGTGSGNVYGSNTCSTSSPGGLC